MKRILIAGIGNIFQGDDGFGCEVIRQMSTLDIPDDVELVDFGIRGMDLGYALMDGYELAILIDTVDQGGAPGTIYVIEPDVGDAGMTESGEPGSEVSPIMLHDMDPAKVLRLVASLGTRRPRVLLVGCQPEFLGGDEGYMGLSATVASAVARAVNEVMAMLDAAGSGNDAACTEQRMSA